MATLVKYVYRCEKHGEQDVLMERRDAGKPTNCCVSGCNLLMKQVFTPYTIVMR